VSTRALWASFAGLLIAAVLLAFVAPAQAAPGGTERVDFGEWNSLSATAVTVSFFLLHTDGAKNSRGQFTWSNEASLLAGPVHADVTTDRNETLRQLFVPTRAWFTTIPGAALIASPFFVGAYASSTLRNIRRRRRVGASHLVGLAFLGAVVGVALDDASWVLGKRLLHSYIAVAVVGLAIAAFLLLSLIAVRRRTSGPRA
jgi:hypothetical protein